MPSDLESVQDIALAATGRIGSELCFRFPEVLNVTTACTKNAIAILGVEIFEVRPEGYATKHLSTYDLKVQNVPKQRTPWLEYVKANNALAKAFINENPAEGKDVYVLTASSWRELLQLLS